MPMSPRLLRPRASGFNPRSISGLYAWWDATDASTYTVGTGVSSWRDKASNIAATQSTGANQPTVSSLNGKTAFAFDAGVSLLATGLSYSITAQSTFAVFRADSVASFARIVSQESDVANATYIQLLLPNTGLFQVGSYIGGGFRSPVAITQSAATIGESHHNGSTLTAVANGVSGTPFGGTLSFSPTKIALGNSAAASNALVGRIGEVLMWNRALTSTEITTVRRYLSAKWGITVS